MGLREAWPGILGATTLAAVATSAACGSAANGPGASCTPASGQACSVDAGAGESGSGLVSPPPPGPTQPADGSGTVTLAGSAIENIFTQIAQTSDIMQDGTQDPTKTCDGISIGLGFEASVVQLGPMVPAVTMPDPCAGDAGTDG